MLLVDIGNSRIKWSRYDQRLATMGEVQTADTGVLDQVLTADWARLPKPPRVLVSNVGGAVLGDRVARWVEAHWDQAPVFAASEGSAFGVLNGYEDPRQLGVDRWLALIAAWRRFRGAVCLADCGTAVTVDALSDRGRHLGGLILPGLSLMRRSLAQAAGLASIEGGRIVSLAHNTADGIASGGACAIAACIDRVAAMLQEHYGRTACVLTGGAATDIAALVGHGKALVPDLVLRGLAIWAGGEA
jgi:type III pantothenate kinase